MRGGLNTKKEEGRQKQTSPKAAIAPEGVPNFLAFFLVL